VRIIDRTIVARFAWNFAVLFLLLFLFAVSIDVILQLEKFLRAARASVEQGRYAWQATAFAGMILEFHGPRLFQFFQFMVGLLAVGAMGFTFAQMHRSRELVAVMAAGVPLRRCVWAVLAAAFALNAASLANQELVLPHFADRLMLDHMDLSRTDRAAFPVALTRDSSGNLLFAGSFDPERQRITGFIGLERDERGSLRRRTTATSATWDEERGAWQLEGGTAVVRDPAVRDGAVRSPPPAPAAEWVTDLSPKAITARHYRLFAQMLSSDDLGRIAAAGAIDPGQADRMRLGRVGSVAVNLLVLAIAVPFFLQRGPANMLHMSVLCAATCVPAIIVSAVVMAAPITGLPPAVSVALPVAALIPAAVARIAWLRS
jgi:lipopolysaccharide export LptBFGC system permease protein LptF